jgi:hypothetical protein
MTTKDVILAFVIGSSIPVTLITLTYVGLAWKKAGRPDSLPFEMFAIILPILLGLFNVLHVYFLKITGDPNVSLYLGMALGLLFSSIGTFALNLPERIFKMKITYMAHIYAFFTYMFISRVIVYPLNRYLIDLPTNPSFLGM